MNLLLFIRLIIRNILLVIVVPIAIGVTIFFVTLNSPETFKSYTTIYTGFASGYSIENGAKNKIDFHDIDVSFDNLINIVKARETKEEVALRLLAHHIFLNKKADKTILQENLNRLNEIITTDLINKVLDKKSEENTYKNLLLFKNQDESNVLNSLLNNESEPYYSIFSIDEIRITRIENSDMMKLEFESNDPGVCQNVLNIICNVFIKKFRGIKEGETSNVSSFFDLQTKLSLEKLNKAEERIKNFRSTNRVINYYEQTKFISEKREDLIDELNKEKMVLASAESAMANAEEKLGASAQLIKTSAEILKKRNEITALNSNLIILENDQNVSNTSELSKMNLNLNQLKNELNEKVTELFKSSTSKEGISHKELASIWIDNLIAVDESKARLPIYSQRLNEIESTYDQFAPMGSNLNKMEREIEIAEKEYLANLASLNAARLREQNLEMSNNLQVVDPAYFPLKPLPNNKKLLVVGGGLVGLLICMFILLMVEILDQTIKSPERALKLLEKPIIGGLPVLNKQTQFLQDNGIIDKMVSMICSKIYQYSRTKLKDTPFLMSVFSTRGGVGKTLIISKIKEHFNKSGKRVLIVLPDNSSNRNHDQNDVVYYDAGVNYPEIETIDQILPHGINKGDYEIMIIEFIQFFDQKAPVGLANQCDLSIMAARADSLWEESDKNALKYFTETFDKPVLVILNNMSSYLLENFIGDVPQNRSKMRQRIKKLIKLDFSK